VKPKRLWFIAKKSKVRRAAETLKAADHIVIGTPMFNLSIPAVLKAYIDQIVRDGVTVSPNNVGLLTGKKTTIIMAAA
jgi:FMN-dependent NADH-azoreductase